MNPQHIVQGKPSDFAAATNKLIASRDVALSIRSITFNDGRLAAVIDESQRIPHASGALIEIEASAQKSPARYIEKLKERNPMWQIETSFALPAEEKGKPAVLVVASLRQP